MKKILLLLASLAFIACNNDDDNSIGTVDGLIPLELTKEFIVGEKWFLESAVAEREVDINGDGNATKDLSSQFPQCDLDSYYQFERTQENVLVLIDGDFVCEDFEERYISKVYDFEIDAKEDKLKFNLNTSQLLGGIENLDGFNDINEFENVKFLISPDSSFKILKGQIQLIADAGNNVFVDYRLKSTIDNRPE